MGRRNRTVKSTEAVLARRLDKEWQTAIYGRLSFENNGLEDERSLQNQILFAEEYVNAYPNLKLIDTYADNGHTGTNFQRPEFLRLMEDIKSGRINCIVVKDLSRFGRNYLEAGYYLEKIFPFLNVRFIAINDNYDSMDEQKKDALILPIKNMVNELYSKDLSKKITATMRMKEKKGEIWYGVPPYGYIRDSDEPFRLSTDEETAPYVRLIFQWSLSGLSYGEIAYRLTQMQAVTPMTRMLQLGLAKKTDSKRIRSSWAMSSVKGILHNPIYMGDTIYNRTYQSIIAGVSAHRQEQKKWFVIPDTHEALVTRADFTQNEKQLDERCKAGKEKYATWEKQREDTPDIFNNLFYCSDCGRKMYYYRNIRKGQIRYCEYYCSGYRYGREESKCNRIAIPDRLVRLLVLDQIRVQLQAGCKLLELKEQIRNSSAGKTHRQQLEENITFLNQKMTGISAKRHKLYENFAEGILTEEDYREIKSRYDGQFYQVSNELMDAEKELNQLSEKNISDIDCRNLLKKLDCTEKLSYELLHEMVSRVEFGSDKVLRVTFRHNDWIKELAGLEEKLE